MDTATRGPIISNSRPKPCGGISDISCIPNLMGELQRLQDDLNAATGRNDPLDLNAAWIDDALRALVIKTRFMPTEKR